MQQAVELFRIDPLVGDDAHNGRHNDGGDTQGTEYNTELFATPLFVAKSIRTKCGEPCAPHEKLHKADDGQPKFYTHRKYFLQIKVNNRKNCC